MILETLDVKKNDIFIYSLNQFSMSKNFKLLNKDAKIKYPKSIHYNDVCRYIADGRPKNLILYRMLTNLTNFDPNYMKYGITLMIDGAREIMYFDPIFAVKELEDLSELETYPNLRFRVQQVGLISLFNKFGEPQFHEAYSFDLEAVEVKHQNDRVFAELIFAFDEVHFDEEEGDAVQQPERKIPQRRFVAMTADEIKSSLIEEDAGSNLATIRRLQAQQAQTAEAISENMQADLRRKQTRDYTDTSTRPMPPVPKNHFDIINTPAPVKKEEEKIQQPVAQPAPQPGPARASFPKKPAQTAAPKGKPTFGDFLNRVKKNIQEEENVEQVPEQQQVINLFKTSAHIQNFVVERSTKQVVLKLRKQEK